MLFKDLSTMIWHQLSNSFTSATVQQFICIKILTKTMPIIYQSSYTVSPVTWLVSTPTLHVHLEWLCRFLKKSEHFFFDIPQESRLKIRHNPDVCYSYTTILWWIPINSALKNYTIRIPNTTFEHGLLNKANLVMQRLCNQKEK